MSSTYGQIVLTVLVLTYFAGVFVGYGICLKHQRQRDDPDNHIRRRREWL